MNNLLIRSFSTEHRELRNRVAIYVNVSNKQLHKYSASYKKIIWSAAKGAEVWRHIYNYTCHHCSPMDTVIYQYYASELRFVIYLRFITVHIHNTRIWATLLIFGSQWPFRGHFLIREYTNKRITLFRVTCSTIKPITLRMNTLLQWVKLAPYKNISRLSRFWG